MPRPTAVLLPGTGSDEVFVRAVFERPLAALRIPLTTPPTPKWGCVTSGFLAALDASADTVRGPLLVGGISLGAQLGAEWALRNPERCAGVLVALPAWNGASDSAPAALAARLSADRIERDGLDAILERAVADVPPWLADELRRAWLRHGARLPGALRAAAAHPAPELARLRELEVPVGVATCTDDPVHPQAVARAWTDALPRAALCATTLTAVGVDREALGRATVLAWLRARFDGLQPS